VDLDGHTYAWNGKHWYDEDDCTIPPRVVRRQLNRLGAGQLAEDDVDVTDPVELRRRALAAEAAGQGSRARYLANRLHVIAPDATDPLRRLDGHLYVSQVEAARRRVSDDEAARRCQSRFTFSQPAKFYTGYLNGLFALLNRLRGVELPLPEDGQLALALAFLGQAGAVMTYLAGERRLFPERRPSDDTLPFGRGRRRARIDAPCRWDEEPDDKAILGYYRMLKECDRPDIRDAVRAAREHFCFDRPYAFYRGYLKAALQGYAAINDRRCRATPEELRAICVSVSARAVHLMNS
jgi:hypothetical protein